MSFQHHTSATEKLNSFSSLSVSVKLYWILSRSLSGVLWATKGQKPSRLWPGMAIISALAPYHLLEHGLFFFSPHVDWSTALHTFINLQSCIRFSRHDLVQKFSICHVALENLPQIEHQNVHYHFGQCKYLLSRHAQLIPVRSKPQFQ